MLSLMLAINSTYLQDLIICQTCRKATNILVQMIFQNVKQNNSESVYLNVFKTA